MCIKVSVFTHGRSAITGDHDLVLSLDIDCGMATRPAPPEHYLDHLHVTTAHPAIKISLRDLLMAGNGAAAAAADGGKESLKMQWASTGPTELKGGTGPFAVPEDQGARFVDLRGVLRAFWRGRGYAFDELEAALLDCSLLMRRCDSPFLCGFPPIAELREQGDAGSEKVVGS